MEILNTESPKSPQEFKTKTAEPSLIDKWSRNNPHPSRVCHFTGLSKAEAVCAVDPRLCPDSTERDPIYRNAPQTKFVTTMKGLNDMPVCTVFKKLTELEDILKKKKKPIITTRSHSCPDGLRVDEIGDFKLELVRRHNPHARRVCHIKGLNDVPVCVVRDELNAEWENRFIVSPGSLAPAFSKPNKKKFNWDLMKNATDYNINTERSTSRTSSRVSVPKMSLIPLDHCDNDLNEELDSIQALDILCSILQTNSLQTVQAWIEQATDEERTVVLRALRDMKERGMLSKPSQAYAKNLASLPENDVSVAYQRKWDQNKSLEEVESVVGPAPADEPKPQPPVKTPTVGTQTPVSVLSNKKQERPPTRIQMTGLSRPTSPASKSRPSTMKSVREKFLQSQMSERSGGSAAAKDPGFSWTVKHRESLNTDLTTKA